ncbi:hypothetical protein WOLCODRAFT_28247 [Wolfiporia cocos MD-104 SS10]|uniref:Uncharacterized protein n=1 Tax=Wolfiporia cocos (strain MD-104) TaxID=742152 RepID=A0A2H3J155_WOLCO|nr:hypothetical protein WOLCODRAFT_28247 [Wolfiporia cocos MD-104 SS10]
MAYKSDRYRDWAHHNGQQATSTPVLFPLTAHINILADARGAFPLGPTAARQAHAVR